MGLRSTAAHRIEAVALGLFFGAELVDELAVLEMPATLAVVVDGLVEQTCRHGEIVELEQAGILEQDDVHQDGHDPLGINGATGDVHYRRFDALFLQELLDAHGVGRIGMRCAPAAITAQEPTATTALALSAA